MFSYEQLRLKILIKLRAASLNSEFTGSYKKKVYVMMLPLTTSLVLYCTFLFNESDQVILWISPEACGKITLCEFAGINTITYNTVGCSVV